MLRLSNEVRQSLHGNDSEQSKAIREAFEMSTDEEAQKGIADLNAYQLAGRSLTVNEARPKPAYAGGGFGGGDSRRRSEPRW